MLQIRLFIAPLVKDFHSWITCSSYEKLVSPSLAHKKGTNKKLDGENALIEYDCTKTQIANPSSPLNSTFSLGTWVANTKLGKFPLEQGDISEDLFVIILTKLLTKLLMSETKDLRKEEPKSDQNAKPCHSKPPKSKSFVKKNPMLTHAQTT